MTTGTRNGGEIYPRMLELSEDGLVSPLWRAAGADAAYGQLKEAWWQTTTAGPRATGSPRACPRAPRRSR